MARHLHVWRPVQPPGGKEGQSVRCNKCGRMFTIPQHGIAVATTDDNSGGNRAATAERPAVSSPFADASAPSSGAPQVEYTPRQLVKIGRAAVSLAPRRRFWSDVGKVLLFSEDRQNLGVLLALLVVLAVLFIVLDTSCMSSGTLPTLFAFCSWCSVSGMRCSALPWLTRPHAEKNAFQHPSFHVSSITRLSLTRPSPCSGGFSVRSQC